MHLTKLLSDIDYVIISNNCIDKVNIEDIAYDSRKAGENTIFVCLKGALTDGHIYAKSAYINGCRCFLCEQPLDIADDAIQIQTSDTRLSLAKISATFFDYPAKKLRIIGITGTKGKTTIAFLTYEVLNKAKIKTASIGTNGIIIDGIRTPTINSTPESYELHKAFSEMVRHDISFVVMEVSSQALYLNRVAGLEFYIGVFTNLSQDHIGEGEHPNFEHYKNCKASMFQHVKYSILNSDDSYYTDMAKNTSCVIQTFAIHGMANFKADQIKLWKSENTLGVKFNCKNNNNNFTVTVKTPGEFSVYNALAVIAICQRVGVKLSYILDTLETTVVKGRFEIIEALPYCTFIIDYAHNALSMRSVLETLRKYSPKRLVCLFGSVGGRTKLRRYEMGKIASELADFCVLTSDNPDFEDPLDIIHDIEHSFDKNLCPYKIIPDRIEAVKYVVSNACSGDVILLAGKGHEDYQIINGKHLMFSEHDIIMDTVDKLNLVGI